jgi:hypothetical protein
MVLAEDLRAIGGGRVILKRGLEVTESSLERLRNHGAAGLLQTESIRVFRGSASADEDGRAAA